MGNDDFSETFQTCFHQVYLQCYRRIRSEHDRLTPQTIAVLSHLTEMGPATVQELTQHFGRAQSSVTELVDRLQANGLVDRMADARDRRRVFIWLTPDGQTRLREATTPLDPARLAALAQRLSPEEQAEFLALFTKLTQGETHEM